MHCSNIIFSNGKLDPWARGGVLSDVGNCQAIYMDKAAHHLDLRLPNAADPIEVIKGRETETTTIK